MSSNTWALFTGTEGPNRKVIIYLEKGQRKSFIKIALSDRSNMLIRNEERILKRLSNSSLKSFEFPKLKSSSKEFIEISDLSKNGKRCKKLNDLHLQAIQELNNFSTLSLPLRVVPMWNKSKSDLETLLTKNDSRIPNGLLRKLYLLIESIDDSKLIETGCSHGDFTSWNMYENDGKLNIYDWELHGKLMPLGFDAFHFIIQQGILVDRQPWRKNTF